jgi:structure-specific endonuclease subunit SLX1
MNLQRPPDINVEQVLEVLQPSSNLKKLTIDYYEGLLLPSWISILSNLVSLQLWNCKKCVQLPSIGKLQSLKELRLYNIDNLKYLDEESQDGMEVRIFSSLEVLSLSMMPNLEGLLRVERGRCFLVFLIWKSIVALNLDYCHGFHLLKNSVSMDVTKSY